MSPNSTQRFGDSTAEAGAIAVTHANEVTLLITAATSYRTFDDVSGDPESIMKAQLDSATGKSFVQLRADHLADYQALFRRVTLDLGRSEAMLRPTDARIRQFADGKDPQLAALYYQCGRYLLISCSRPGGQPATLRGLWNESLNPPWQSKYTININTEMNYWPAEAGNLAECVEPLIGMVNDLMVTGGRTAHTIQAAATLGLDEDLRQQLAGARARLAPNQVGSAGQLQEWLEDWDLQAPEIRHRHVSHLYGLYPGRDITLSKGETHRWNGR